MLAPQKKSYDKHSVLKSRDITLPTKVHLVKAMVFPVVMYGCETWTVKKAEHRRIDALINEHKFGFYWIWFFVCLFVCFLNFILFLNFTKLY